MIIKNAITLISNKGFQFTKGNIANLYMFLKQSANAELDVCLLIDNTNNEYFIPSSLEQLCDAIQRKFLFNGFKKVNFFFLILSDDIERDKVILSQPYPFWIIDTIGKRIMIYDDQPEDYYHLRNELESLLISNPININLKSYIPFVTISLIIINIIVFLFTSFHGGEYNTIYLLEHGASYWKYIFEDHEYYRLFTCMFIHFNGEHILNNMITLAIIGTETEKFLGHIRFLAIYLLSGLGASFLSALYYMHNMPDVVTVAAGASGAIFGILGSLIIIMILFKKYRRNIRPMNLIIIAILSISNGYLSSSIDNVAHIGGLLFGIILTFISCLYRKNILK